MSAPPLRLANAAAAAGATAAAAAQQRVSDASSLASAVASTPRSLIKSVAEEDLLGLNSEPGSGSASAYSIADASEPGTPMTPGGAMTPGGGDDPLTTRVASLEARLKAAAEARRAWQLQEAEMKQAMSLLSEENQKLEQRLAKSNEGSMISGALENVRAVFRHRCQALSIRGRSNGRYRRP